MSKAITVVSCVTAPLHPVTGLVSCGSLIVTELTKSIDPALSDITGGVLTALDCASSLGVTCILGAAESALNVIHYGNELINSFSPQIAQADGVINGGYAPKCDVYVAGWNYVSEVEWDAKLWKNGVEQIFIDGTSWTKTTSVYVSNNDVYVVGYRAYLADNFEDFNLVAMLWKNGVAQNLSDNTGYSVANSVFVSDNDVYVAGSKLWKNGVIQKLTNGTDHPGGSSVFVSGSDVYVAGDEYSGQQDQNGNYNGVAKLWKNGIAQNLTDGTRRAHASSVFVSGSDVYVVGCEYYGQPNQFGNYNAVAKLWKNGAVQNLSDDTRYSEANSVFVSGNDVYVAGYEGLSNRIAKLWKNGIAQNLSNGTTANSVFVSGNDVYVVGFGGIYPNIGATLWKNGVAQMLHKGTNVYSESDAFSVFVVE